MVKKSNKHLGFSLVELSVVLVIIGLLVGGVMVGRNLIKSAELKTVITEKMKFETAIKQFRSQYYSLPGDMADATYYWGEVGDTVVTDSCASGDAGEGKETCNGNGDGYTLDPNDAVVDGNEEEQYAWEHMSNAGFLDIVYDGTSNPISGFQEHGWGFSYMNNTGEATEWLKHYGQFLRQWFFIPKDAKTIDDKIDDGKPGTGKILCAPVTVCALGADNEDFDADYKLDAPAESSRIYFLIED